MKFKKTKKLHTVEFYATCICAMSTCSCSCSVCVCACNGTAQPTANDQVNGRSDATNSNYNRDFYSNMTAQNAQMG